MGKGNFLSHSISDTDPRLIVALILNTKATGAHVC